MKFITNAIFIFIIITLISVVIFYVYLNKIANPPSMVGTGGKYLTPTNYPTRPQTNNSNTLSELEKVINDNLYKNSKVTSQFDKIIANTQKAKKENTPPCYYQPKISYFITKSPNIIGATIGYYVSTSKTSDCLEEIGQGAGTEPQAVIFQKLNNQWRLISDEKVICGLTNGDTSYFSTQLLRPYTICQ